MRVVCGAQGPGISAAHPCRPLPPPPRPAFPHTELHLATSSLRVSSLKAALSGSWPFLLSLVVLPKVAKDPPRPTHLRAAV